LRVTKIGSISKTLREARLMKVFANRIEAGALLAKKLVAYSNQPDVIVLALPRGGVPVGYAVAHALNAPLDVFLVRKLGVPGHEELAMGAIASGNVRVLNDEVVDYLEIPDDLIDEVAEREQRELERREKLYRGSSAPPNVRGRTVIVVDDGLATGSTMRAAVNALKKMGTAKIIVAAPVAARDTCESFKNAVDSTCVCAMTPEPFGGVGLWYRDFSQTSDAEVCYLLKRARDAGHKRVA
jgi:putative phosphoribosyl transferase